MIYRGSCHCGDITFEAEGDLGEVLACNCSICQRKGSLLWFVPREYLTLRTPAANLSTYTFNKHAIQHHFCAKCGTHPFGEATSPDGKAMAAINVRCLEDIEIDDLPVRHFNGRAL
jgi:hypothetical protein